MKLVHFRTITGVAGVAFALSAVACQSRTDTGAADRAEQRAQEARQEAQQARADAERARQQSEEERAEARAAEQARHDAEQRAETATARAQREEARADHEAYAHGAARTGVTERQPTRAVLFAPGSTALSADARHTLDDVVRTIRARGEGHGVVVEGYADDTGPDATNDDLSRRRADAVADYLAGAGIPRSGITTRALGAHSPAAHDDSEHGRAMNRRVEILIQP